MQCSWLASAQPAKLQRVLSSRPELRVRLPRTLPDVEFLRNDLTEFSCKYRVAASLQLLEVVIVFSQDTGADVVALVREELLRLLYKYVPELVHTESERGVQPADEATATARAEEKETLQAIYGTEFEVLAVDEWRVHLFEGAALRVLLPPEYPRGGESPPTPSIECPRFTPPSGLADELLAQWSSGDVCIYQWAEHLRAALHDQQPTAAASAEEGEGNNDGSRTASAHSTYVEPSSRGARGQKKRGHKFSAASGDSRNSVPVYHSEPLIDRKSRFQAHAARVKKMEQVEWVHRHLLSDRDISVAAHNIVAYRFRDEKQQLVAHWDDDRESGAGKNLDLVLEKSGAEDIFMMVSRWKPEDAPKIGPDRYKNAGKVAQELLKQMQTSSPAAPSLTRGYPRPH